ncbi:hypothetical protein N656DRAFT_801620 [Canariomyces notabilis]|uniref:Uncharacterized protein n=1 Tax=Canariomyces notabilis TaxID=2074819 RepID=A0AAN6QK81_9PEZI|nr:hypothetical protein N656DRAFT_801620 [Canariomyces arenarius]
MPGRRVSFDLGSSKPTRSGRGHHHNRRSHSAERVHRLADDFPEMRPAPSYDQLVRENHILKLDLREKDQELQRERALAEHYREQAVDLQRSLDANSDQDARRDGKLKDLRKKNARLEVENADLAAQIRDLGRQLREALDARAARIHIEVERWKNEAADWRRRYEETHARYEDVHRRLDRMRRNMDDVVQENTTLKVQLRRGW